MAEQLDFSWRCKGSRDYLQGADLHDQTCAALAQRGLTDLLKVDLAMHTMAREGLTGLLVAPGEPAPERPLSVFRFESGGEKRAVFLLPNGQPLTEREPYPEEEIVAAATLELAARRIGLAPLAHFSNLEQIVALNKRLMQQLYPEAPGKWIFTGLKAPRSLWPLRWQRLELQFETAFELALTRSAIVADGESIGRIFFSLLR